MKAIYLFMCLLFASSHALKAQPQQITIKTKKDYQLKGDVKQIVTSFENYTKKIVSEVLEFTPEGNLQYEGWLDSPQQGITYTYDKAGRLTKRKMVVKDNDYSITTYTYNMQGLLIKEESDTGGGKPAFYETYQYDSYGNIREVGLLEIPTYSYRNIYDARKRLIKTEKLYCSSRRLLVTTEITYLPNGWSKYVETMKLEKRLLEYDNKGRVRSDKRCDLQSGDVFLFITSSYDDNDNLIESQVLNKKINYIYNDLGELASKEYTGFDKDGFLTDESYTYTKHDAKGNWLERVIVYPKTNKEGRQETRTITYYPVANTSSSAQPASQQNKAPRFPGGESAMVKFFADNANPREPAIATAGYGEVIVEFTVTEEGTIEDTKWKGRVSVSMDQEALRLVNMMPKWNPGLVDGQPAKMKVQVGLRFFPNQAFRYIKAMLD